MWRIIVLLQIKSSVYALCVILWSAKKVLLFFHPMSQNKRIIAWNKWVN